MQNIRKSPGKEKFLSLVPEEKNFDKIKQEIMTTLIEVEESEDFKKNVSSKKPLTKILRNFGKQFAPTQARKIETFECFRYLLLISEVDYFYVALCIKLDFFNKPTLNIYQSFKKGKDFVHSDEEDCLAFKCFEYDFGYYFNHDELNFEVRKSKNFELPKNLNVYCEPVIKKVQDLVN